MIRDKQGQSFDLGAGPEEEHGRSVMGGGVLAKRGGLLGWVGR
jgi:hypothetical protein